MVKACHKIYHIILTCRNQCFRSELQGRMSVSLTKCIVADALLKEKDFKIYKEI